MKSSMAVSWVMRWVLGRLVRCVVFFWKMIFAYLCFLAQCFCRRKKKKHPNDWSVKQPLSEVHSQKRELIVSFIP